MNEKTAREIAIAICGGFEGLLDEKGILIPSADRRGRPEEACLYGEEYWRMEDGITDMLMAQPNARISNEESWSASHPARRLAIRICDEFEELVAEHDIRIPSNDRAGDPEEGCLFSSEYYGLEDAITEILIDRLGTCKQRRRASGVSKSARPAVVAMQGVIVRTPLGFAMDRSEKARAPDDLERMRRSKWLIANIRSPSPSARVTSGCRWDASPVTTRVRGVGLPVREGIAQRAHRLGHFV